MEERTDEALLASHIASEDGNSFEELLGRYVNELIPFLTRLTGSKAAADDVFQETFPPDTSVGTAHSILHVVSAPGSTRLL